MSHQKKQNANASSFIVDFLAGGLSGSVAKTIAAPVERESRSSFRPRPPELMENNTQES